MNSESLDPELLARYLAGECTEKECQRFEQQLAENPNKAEKVKEIQNIWNASRNYEGIADGMFDIKQEWDALNLRLDDTNETKKAASDHSSKSRSGAISLHSWTQKLVRVAAVFLLAGLIGVITYQQWGITSVDKAKPLLREITTADAQRANLVLGDGTKVMLNAASDLRLPNKFEGEVREVFLEGEAFFEVKRNPEKPFLIHSRGAVIRVLGTSFSVRSYPEEENVQVVVKEGRVSFGSDEEESDTRSTILTANELGRMNLNTHALNHEPIEDLQLYLSWRKGYLKFRNAPMKQVARELERRYGVSVTFEQSTIAGKSLTAFLKSRSIRNVLDVIGISLDLDYELKDNQVEFSIKQ